MVCNKIGGSSSYIVRIFLTLSICDEILINFERGTITLIFDKTFITSTFNCKSSLLCDVDGGVGFWTQWYDIVIDINRVHKNINRSSEGREHCKNAIGIEIPTIKLQKNQVRIMSVDILLGKILDRHIIVKGRRQSTLVLTTLAKKKPRTGKFT
jgi:hypothetical protein